MSSFFLRRCILEILRMTNVGYFEMFLPKEQNRTKQNCLLGTNMMPFTNEKLSLLVGLFDTNSKSG